MYVLHKTTFCCFVALTKLFLKLQLSSCYCVKLEKGNDRITLSLDRNKVGDCVVLRDFSELEQPRYAQAR